MPTSRITSRSASPRGILIGTFALALGVAACHKDPAGPHYVSTDVTGEWTGALDTGTVRLDLEQSDRIVTGAGSWTGRSGASAPVIVRAGSSDTGDFGDGVVETGMAMRVYVQPAGTQAVDFYYINCILETARRCVGNARLVLDTNTDGNYPITPLTLTR
jgi:hypothetical protein